MQLKQVSVKARDGQIHLLIRFLSKYSNKLFTYLFTTNSQ